MYATVGKTLLFCQHLRFQQSVHGEKREKHHPIGDQIGSRYFERVRDGSMPKVIARGEHGQAHGPVAVADQRHIAERCASAEHHEIQSTFVAFGQKDLADGRNDGDGHIEIGDLRRMVDFQAELGGDQSDWADAGEHLRVTVEGLDGFLKARDSR